MSDTSHRKQKTSALLAQQWLHSCRLALDDMKQEQ